MTKDELKFMFNLLFRSVSERPVLVIENLFCERKITNKYDLKGSERNRLVDPSGQSGETVLLDENLIKSKILTIDNTCDN